MKKILFALAIAAVFAAVYFYCGTKPSVTVPQANPDVTEPGQPPKPVVEEIPATDSTPALWSIDGVKWLKEEKDAFLNWNQANYSACPDDYRVPTMEEFKQLAAILPELAKNPGGYSRTLTLADYSTKDTTLEQGEAAYWWTATIPALKAADESPDEKIPLPTVTAAKLSKDAPSLEFLEMPIDVSLKVRCIQDTGNTPVFVNSTALKMERMDGYISGVSLQPYYEDSFENMGCADCCCEEGNGGRLTVDVNTEGGVKKQFEVLELGSDFCGTIAKEIKGESRAMVDRKDDCKLSTMQNFSFLQLFQPGVKVKLSSCESHIFIHSEMGDSYAPASCGDSITLNFTATIKEIGLIPPVNPDDEKVCSYVFGMTDSTKEIQASAPCSNVNAGENYNVEVTIILEPLTGKDMNPIREMFYPCCYGETRSYQLTDIKFSK